MPLPNIYKDSNNIFATSKNEIGAIQVAGVYSLIYPVIFSQYRLVKSEKVQVIEAFDEAIHLYAFGKGADRLVLSGSVMAPVNSAQTDESNLSAQDALISKYDNEIRAFRAAQSGNLLVISGPSGVVLPGFCDGLELSAQAEINAVLVFQISIIGVDEAYSVGASTVEGTSSSSVS